MVTCTGHIGIHEGADVRTEVHDVIAIKPNFLTSMGYHIFLSMVAHAELRYQKLKMHRSSLHLLKVKGLKIRQGHVL